MVVVVVVVVVVVAVMIIDVKICLCVCMCVCLLLLWVFIQREICKGILINYFTKVSQLYLNETKLLCPCLTSHFDCNQDFATRIYRNNTLQRDHLKFSSSSSFVDFSIF